MAKAKSAIPEGFHTVTPQLTLDNCAEAIEWYKRALGAKESNRADSPDGKVMHSELTIGNSKIMVNDPMGPKAAGPRGLGGSPAALWLYVEDCDAVFNRAISAGATVTQFGEVRDQFWGDRTGTFKDPAGYAWTVATHKEDLTREEIDARAAEFFKQFAAQ